MVVIITENCLKLTTRSSAVAVIADRTACNSNLRSATVSRLMHYCVISIFTLFTVIAASRPVNKNVSTGAVIRAKPGTEPGVHKQLLLANYQTGGYKFRPMSGWNVRIGPQPFFFERTH